MLRAERKINNNTNNNNNNNNNNNKRKSVILKSDVVTAVKKKHIEIYNFVTHDMLEHTWQQLNYRLAVCGATNGDHIEV
jgi:hypothetical protein